MPLGKQMLPMCIIMRTCKRPSHILEGFPGALSFSIVILNSIPVVDFIQTFLAKKIQKEWELKRAFQNVLVVKLPWVEVGIASEGKMT
jgi:hypothetical protein